MWSSEVCGVVRSEVCGVVRSDVWSSEGGVCGVVRCVE